jgi:kynurenine formamidase
MTVACAPPTDLFRDRIVVDLSYSYNAATIYWPTEDGFLLKREAAGITEGGYWYAANRFRSAEHGGTHIDAPEHFAHDQWTVDEIPLETLVGPAVLLDVHVQVEADPDYQVTIGDFETWEAQNGKIPNGTIVLIHTGFGGHWPDRARYLGTAEFGPEAVEKLHFPGLAPSAAKWLVEERRIHAVGLDTASIDHGPSLLFETHRALFAANVPAFENLANLHRLPARGFIVVALPMKIEGGSGAPLRAIALVPH